MNLARERQQLARLVRIRDRQRDLAAAAFESDRRAHAEAVDDHTRAVAAVADLPPGQSFAAWELEQLGELAAATRAVVDTAGARLDESRAELRAAAAALEQARTLHERARAALRGQVLRAEQRAADDRHRRGGQP